MKRFAMILLVLSAACDGGKRNPPLNPPTNASAGVTIGGKRIDVTLVVTEKDRRHAVARLVAPGENQGYLLAWPRERFMKVESDHSRVGWDVVFLDKAGAVVDVRALPPSDEEGVMPKVPAQYALLVAAGVGQKLGVKAGDKAELSPEVSSAKVEDLIPMKVGGVPILVELALNEPERNHGLMFRPRMSADDGMLFAYPIESERGFWMKNTLIPLDIAFFAADGTLLNVNETPCAADPRVGPWPTSPSKGDARFVLEMNLGWFKKKGLLDNSGNVAPGTRAEIPPQAFKGTYD